MKMLHGHRDIFSEPLPLWSVRPAALSLVQSDGRLMFTEYTITINPSLEPSAPMFSCPYKTDL